MPITNIGALWTPAIWIKELRERQATFPSILNTGAVLKSPRFDEIATGAGVSANIPFFKDISDGDDEIQVEGTAPGVDGLVTGLQVTPILNRVKATGATALSAAVSGTEPITEIMSILVARRLKQRHKTILAVLRGAFGTLTGASGVAAPLSACRLDKFDETGIDATALQIMSINNFIDAKSMMGELADDLLDGAMFIHSTVLAALEKEDVTQFKEKSMTNYTVRTYKGVQIIISDSLVRAGTTNGFVYETYLLGRDTIAYGEKAQVGDVIDTASLQLDESKPKNEETIYDRTRFVAHVNGMKWVGTASGQSATNAELAVIANWNLVQSSAHRTGIVCIRTNG